MQRVIQQQCDVLDGHIPFHVFHARTVVRIGVEFIIRILRGIVIKVFLVDRHLRRIGRSGRHENHVVRILIRRGIVVIGHVRR